MDTCSMVYVYREYTQIVYETVGKKNDCRPLQMRMIEIAVRPSQSVYWEKIFFMKIITV